MPQRLPGSRVWLRGGPALGSALPGWLWGRRLCPPIPFQSLPNWWFFILPPLSLLSSHLQPPLDPFIQHCQRGIPLQHIPPFPVFNPLCPLLTLINSSNPILPCLPSPKQTNRYPHPVVTPVIGTHLHAHSSTFFPLTHPVCIPLFFPMYPSHNSPFFLLSSPGSQTLS